MSYEWRYNTQEAIGYLKLSDKRVEETVVLVTQRVHMDKDKDGKIVGIEILL